jgi:hypothetical protein
MVRLFLDARAVVCIAVFDKRKRYAKLRNMERNRNRKKNWAPRTGVVVAAISGLLPFCVAPCTKIRVATKLQTNMAQSIESKVDLWLHHEVESRRTDFACRRCPRTEEKRLVGDATSHACPIAHECFPFIPRNANSSRLLQIDPPETEQLLQTARSDTTICRLNEIINTDSIHLKGFCTSNYRCGSYARRE